MMKEKMKIEVLAKELEEAFAGRCVDITPKEYLGVFAMELTKATVEYREDDYEKELVFNTGNHNTDGFASANINLDIIEDIIRNGDEFEIVLTGAITPITITPYETIYENCTSYKMYCDPTVCKRLMRIEDNLAVKNLMFKFDGSHYAVFVLDSEVGKQVTDFNLTLEELEAFTESV